MAQNTSTAVMQRRVEPHDSLDDFPTPPWAARALCEHVIATDPLRDTVWEPACNRGFLARGLKDYFQFVRSSDIHDYGDENPDQQRVQDFLIPWADSPVQKAQGIDWIITNPPFRLAEQFALRGIEAARKGVALLVRSAFVEGVGRHDRLFSPRGSAHRCPVHRARSDGEGAV